MAVTQAFTDAVNNNDVRLIRIMMKDSLLIDPTFREFNEMAECAKNVDGLYDEHDGKEFITDEDLWDEDYLDKIMVQLVRNFSHERIDHVKDVVRKLKPVKMVAGENGSDKESAEIGVGTRMCEGAIIGAAAGVVVGVVASVPVLGVVATAGVGACAGAAVAYAVSNKE
ncbi:MAG: hypothetical protein MSH32_12305 [Lachnospiraceae bacterium]|nr:hypothetical protein [Lachnospiraceae bacterium]